MIGGMKGATPWLSHNVYVAITAPVESAKAIARLISGVCAEPLGRERHDENAGTISCALMSASE